MKYGSLSQVCDSPIEKHFLDGWISNHLGALVTRQDGVDWKSHIYIECPLISYSIFCQRRIGPYRVDFFVTRHGDEETHVIVECDGHAFHEKTPEQAAKDRARERELIRMRYTVLRFTGSELYRDGAKCAREVQEYLEVQNA